MAGNTQARIKAARAAGEARLARAQQSVPAVDAGLRWFERERLSGAALLAGGLAYRFFFWLVSFGLVLAAIASFWAHADPESLESAAKSTGLGGVAAHSATSALASGEHTQYYFLVVGLFLSAYFGLGAVRALRVAAFLAWRLRPAKLASPVKASAAFCGLAGLALVTGAVLPALRGLGLVEIVAVYAVAFVVYGALILLAFSHLPHPDGLDWRALLPGAQMVAAGVVGMHAFVVHYLAAKLARSPDLYGSFGSATVVLVWLFLAGRLLVAGMFLNATLWHHHTETETSISSVPDESGAAHPA
ncbi:MAG: YhjD/YihY/BrkB family envelope integrity protein [Thermoleophilaceae bacterium]